MNLMDSLGRPAESQLTDHRSQTSDRHISDLCVALPAAGHWNLSVPTGAPVWCGIPNVDVLHQNQPLDAEPSPPSASSRARTLHHRIIPPHLLTSVSKRLRHSFLFSFAFSPHLLTLLLSALAKPHHKQLIAPLTLIQRLNKGPHQLSFPFERTFI